MIEIRSDMFFPVDSFEREAWLKPITKVLDFVETGKGP
jgi:hypothetical protein